MWMPVSTSVVGEEDNPRTLGKKKRVASVFDRISNPNSPAASPARQDRRTL